MYSIIFASYILYHGFFTFFKIIIMSKTLAHMRPIAHLFILIPKPKQIDWKVLHKSPFVMALWASWWTAVAFRLTSNTPHSQRLIKTTFSIWEMDFDLVGGRINGFKHINVSLLSVFDFLTFEDGNANHPVMNEHNSKPVTTSGGLVVQNISPIMTQSCVI